MHPCGTVAFGTHVVLCTKSKYCKLFVTTKGACVTPPQLQVNKWPNGVVPYSLDGFSTRELGNIREAMDMYMNGTCVSFRQRQPYDRAYVQITKVDSAECSSNVGMVTARGTVGVSRTVLSSNCSNIGSILHELGHILGRYHEHSRLDRDSYVEILYQNIYAYAISNFFIYFDTYTPIAYDYNSIMHYDSRAYSTNGLDTIRPLHNISTPSTPAVLWHFAHMGQRLYLTELDYANINFMYNCNTTHPFTTEGAFDSTSVLLSTTTHPFSAVDLSTTPVTFTSSRPAFGVPKSTQGLVLNSAVQTPVYTTTPTAFGTHRTSVYSLNSKCICHIWCMYKVLLYFFIVFWY